MHEKSFYYSQLTVLGQNNVSLGNNELSIVKLKLEMDFHIFWELS